MPEVEQQRYAKMKPEDRNRIIYLENRIRILNAFNELRDLTYSEALEKAQMIGKDRTFASHLKILVKDGRILRKEDRKYHISEIGRTEIPVLKQQIEKIRENWKISRPTEDIPDHRIIATSGEVKLPTISANEVNSQKDRSPTYSYLGSIRMSSYSYNPKDPKDFVYFGEADEAIRLAVKALVPKLPEVDRIDLSLSLIKKQKENK